MATFPITSLVLQGPADANGNTINNLDLTGLGLTKASVGLGNVDNTSDAGKPVSTATSAALGLKQNFIPLGTTGQFWRGDKTFVNYGALALQDGATTLPELSSIGASATASAIIAAKRNDWGSSFAAVALEQYGASYVGSALTAVPFANSGILNFVNTSRAIIKTNGATPIVFGTNGNRVAQLLNGLNVGGTGDPGFGCIAAADTINAQHFLGSSIFISGPPGNGSLIATRGTIVYLLVGNGASVDATPLKFVSGPLLPSPQAGGVEFEGDRFYGTVTTGSERKEFAFIDDVIGGAATDFVHTSGNEDIAGVKTFFDAPILPVKAFPPAIIDYTDTELTEAATITLPLGSISSCTVSGTLTTVAFDLDIPTSAQPAITLRLIVTGGPYTLAIPTSARLGETGSISTITLQNGNHELSWVYAAEQYWLADSAGAGVTVLSHSANYTSVLTDANKTLLHPSTDNNARTFTIAANASVAYIIGTELTFLNQTATALSIAIATDTMTLIGAGTTGIRSLANNGKATAQKVTATSWVIQGTNLT